MRIKPGHILPLIVFSLLLAIWSGWIRLGWPMSSNGATNHHGALMVGSFLSTVIFLERAVTFKNQHILLLPLLNALSAVFFIGGSPLVGQSLLLAGSVGFCIMCLHFIYKYEELHYYLFFAAAFCLAIGNWLLLRSNFYPQATSWWMGFFLLTIVAERLELTRFLPVTKNQVHLLLFCLLLAFIGLLVPFHMHGATIFATGIILTAAWLLKNDMAMKSVKKAGQHRYSAVLLITGYVWLIITGLFMYAGNVNAFWYDATLHSFFIGFVISMIFSHAPIILPGVLQLPVKPYHPGLYVLFVIMQVSLIARVIADGLIMVVLRKWAGMVNGITLLLFFISVAALVMIDIKKRKALKA